MRDLFRRIWNEIGIYKARHPLIQGMWFVGGRQFLSRQPTEEEQFLLSLRLQGKVVYDIGANVGIMTLFFARAVGEAGQVIAFEPHPYSFYRLKRNISLNRLSNVRTFQKAVGDCTASLDLFQPSRHLSAATFDRERAAQLKEGDLIVNAVEVDTLDTFITRYHLPAPDFIKVDVEGFEVKVLAGARQTIERHKPDWIVEIHRDSSENPTTRQVVMTLAPYGYRFYHVERRIGIDVEGSEAVKGGHLFASVSQEEMV